MRCGYDYTCTYKDGFADFYNQRVRTADIIVFAGTVKGRYLSSMWKTFYDRAYFWNHTPSLAGKQLGYIIAGPLRQNPNLIQILEASSTARQYANHVDIIPTRVRTRQRLTLYYRILRSVWSVLLKKGTSDRRTFSVLGGTKFLETTFGEGFGLFGKQTTGISRNTSFTTFRRKTTKSGC
jgi:hypothetical protein